jgi:hypothetical protein
MLTIILASMSCLFYGIYGKVWGKVNFSKEKSRVEVKEGGGSSRAEKQRRHSIFAGG